MDEFDGIREQVGEALSQAGLVAEHNGEVAINVDVRVRRLELGIRLQHAPQEGVGVHRLRLMVLAHHCAVLQGVGDELVHPVGGVNDVADVFQAGGMEAVGAFFQEDAAEGVHRAKGGAHVVGDRVGEMLQFGDGLLEFGGAVADLLFQFRVGLGQLGPGGEQSCFGLSALDDFRLQPGVPQVGGFGQLMLAHRADHQRLVHREHLLMELRGLGAPIQSLLQPCRAAGSSRWGWFGPHICLYFVAFGSGAASSSCAWRGPVCCGIPVVNPV